MQADRYTRLVAWLKVVLPLTALAILSTLFLLSRVIDPEAVIPFAEKEIQDRLREQQVTGPYYTGVTADGDEISFRAESLKTPLGGTGGNRASDIAVTVGLKGGTEIDLTARQGLFDLGRDLVNLEGEIVITTSTGYRITSDHLQARVSQIDLHSPGPVAATGPLGRLNAGQMTLSSGPEDTPAHLVFTNRVKLIYTPQTFKE